VPTSDQTRAREIAERLREMLDGVRPLDVVDHALPLAREGIRLADPEAEPDVWASLHLRIGALATAAGNDRGDLAMLREGIAANTTALEFCGSDPASRDGFKAHNNRALGLVYLGQLSDDPAPMAEAIAELRGVLARLSRDAPEGRWGNCAGSLGTAYWGFGLIAGEVRSIRRAIACFRLASRAYDRTGYPGDAYWATYNGGLANLTLGDLTGDARDYDRAIAILERVRDAKPDRQDLREWATVGDAIALARANRGEVVGDADAIAAAIAECQVLLSAMQRDVYPAWWAMIMVNLCEFTLRLATLRGDPAGMVAAAEATVDAREVAAAESIPAYWTALMQTAAKARLQVGAQTGDPAQVEQAIALSGRALDGRQVGARERASLLTLRGRAARRLAMLRPGEAAPLAARALADFDAALALVNRRAAPSLWSTIGLARAETLVTIGGRGTIDLAIQGFSSVLETLPETNAGPRRGTALAGRGRARLAAIAAGGADDAISIAADFRAARLILREDIDPAAAIEAAKGEASALLLAGRWKEAAAVAGGLVDRAAVLMSAEPAEHARLNLAEALAGSGDLAAYALLRSGRAEEALARHEGGRTHRLRGRLREAEAALDERRGTALARLRRRADLARRALAQAIERDRPAAVLARLARGLHDEHGRFASALGEAGIEATAILPDVAALRQTIGDAVVTLPVVTPAGGALLVLGGSATTIGVEVIWLDGLTVRAVDDMLGSGASQGWLPGYGRFRDALAGGSGVAGADAVAAFQVTVARTLETCWSLAMQALDQRLRAAGLPSGTEVILVPDGRLSALPLHAAGDGVDAFLDCWAVSYAPSLTAFLACRRRAEARSAGEARLLAVTDPGLDLGRLVNPASAAFPPAKVRALHGAEATRATVVGALPDATYVSFFTHAEWNQEHPERSALRLANGESLAAEDLAALDLGSCRLAVMGACESGVPGLRIAADEFRGMPSALLEAGIPGTLATLWPVFTHSTDRVVGDFFRHHLADGLSPARALRLAQLTQRRNAMTTDLGLASMGIRRVTATSGQASVATSHDLSLPVFWAAFAYIGA
jgi:tetratricopeptide (TPR) repeat protein